LGAFFGSKILPKANVRKLRILFSFVIFFLALSMIYNAVTGKL